MDKAKSARPLYCAIMAAAIAFVPLQAASQSPAYTARGQEPGWSLLISEQTLAFTTQTGGRFEAANPRPGQPARGRYDVVFNGKPVGISIASGICRDTMSGMPHPDRVTISGLNGNMNGCGGAPRALLGSEEWSITEIASSGVLGDTTPSIVFLDDNAVAGNGSCNRYRGGFKLTGEGLRIEQLASTMMACPPPVMQQELSLIRQLEATQGFDIRADGALILKDAKGGTVIAVKKAK